MAGGGSMKAMTTILRNNRNLLRKKNMFKKERTFLNSSKESYSTIKGKIKIKKATHKELSIAKQNAVTQRKVDRLRGWLLATILIVPILIYGIYTFNKTDIENIQQFEIVKKDDIEQNLNEYTFLLEDGDKWIVRQNWNNAIYRYEQAVKLFPEEFEANYRLALAYSYSCMYNNKNCDIGKALTNNLLKYVLEEKNLHKLKSVFEK